MVIRRPIHLLQRHAELPLFTPVSRPGARVFKKGDECVRHAQACDRCGLQIFDRRERSQARDVAHRFVVLKKPEQQISGADRSLHIRTARIETESDECAADPHLRREQFRLERLGIFVTEPERIGNLEDRHVGDESTPESPRVLILASGPLNSTH